MAMLSTPCLLLIDAMALAYRSFHAIPPLTAADGTPTNAIFGFVKALRHLRERFQPTHQAVVFDGGLPPKRLALLSDYKAQREPMPADLARQLPLLDEYLDAARISRIRLDDEEADDVLATLASKAEVAGMQVRMATNDKDLFQVVSASVALVSPVKDAVVMGPMEVEAKTGVKPEQIPDWLALVGDSADNIPGVPGVGPKTAARLLVQFGSWSNIWASLASIPGEKTRSALHASKFLIERNQSMVTLDLEVAGVPDLESLRVAMPDAQQLHAFFHRLNMPSLAPVVPAPTQQELF